MEERGGRWRNSTPSHSAIPAHEAIRGHGYGMSGLCSGCCSGNGKKLSNSKVQPSYAVKSAVADLVSHHLLCGIWCTSMALISTYTLDSSAKESKYITQSTQNCGAMDVRNVPRMHLSHEKSSLQFSTEAFLLFSFLYAVLSGTFFSISFYPYVI